MQKAVQQFQTIRRCYRSYKPSKLTRRCKQRRRISSISNAGNSGSDSSATGHGWFRTILPHQPTPEERALLTREAVSLVVRICSVFAAVTALWMMRSPPASSIAASTEEQLEHLCDDNGLTHHSGNFNQKHSRIDRNSLYLIALLRNSLVDSELSADYIWSAFVSVVSDTSTANLISHSDLTALLGRIASQKSSTAIQRTVYVIQTLASKNLHPTEIDLKNIVLACSESPNSIASILGILSYPQKHENLIQAACTLNQLRLADLIFEHSLSDTSSNANPKILIRTLLSLRLFSRADLVYDRMVDSGRWSVQKGSQHMIHELLSKAQTFDLAFKYLIRLANVSDSVEVQLAAKIMKAMESENVASSNLFRASDLIYFLDCLSRKCTDIPPSLSDRISLMRNSIEDRSKQTLNILSGWSYIRGDTLTMKYVMAEHIKLSRISAGSTIHSNPRKLWNKIIFAESLCSNTQVINDNFQKMEELNIVLDSKSLSAKIHSQLNRKDYTSAILSYKHQLSTKIIPKASVFDRILAAEIVMMQNCPTVGAIINIIKTYRPIVTKEFKISEKTLLIVANVFTANLENLPQSTQFLSFLQTEFPETKFTAPIYNRIMFACINAYASEFVAEIEAHMSQTATLPDSNTFFLLLKSMCKRLSNAGTGIRTEHVWAIYAKMSKSGVALSKRHCELMMEITCIVGTHDEILQMWMMVIGAGFQMSETVIGSLLKILIKRTKPGTRKQLEKELGGNRSVDFRKICDTLIERNTILGTANSQLIFEWLKTDVCGN